MIKKLKDRNFNIIDLLKCFVGVYRTYVCKWLETDGSIRKDWGPLIMQAIKRPFYFKEIERDILGRDSSQGFQKMVSWQLWANVFFFFF